VFEPAFAGPTPSLDAVFMKIGRCFAITEPRSGAGSAIFSMILNDSNCLFT
jgi:hypothetical protein